jgi:hypothetical protein
MLQDKDFSLLYTNDDLQRLSKPSLLIIKIGETPENRIITHTESFNLFAAHVGDDLRQGNRHATIFFLFTGSSGADIVREAER